MKQENPASAAVNALSVQNGTFTVAHEELGHFTLKLHTAQKGNLAGKRILSLLIGSDNTTDYKGVAFWDDERKRVNVWKRFRLAQGVCQAAPIDGKHWSDDGWSAIEKKLAIWCDLATRLDGETGERNGFWQAEGYTLLHEGRCVACNRKLTEPESIRLGIGPTCRERQA